MKKCDYELNKASGYYYNHVTDKRTKLCLTQTKYDKELFYRRQQGKCADVLYIHVDASGMADD